jgi:hypothetical protein
VVFTCTVEAASLASATKAVIRTTAQFLSHALSPTAVRFVVPLAPAAVARTTAGPEAARSWMRRPLRLLSRRPSYTLQTA